METETQKLFENLCQFIDGVDFRKAPYKGIFKRIAERRSVERQAIYNAVKRDRNVATMLAVREEVIAIGHNIQGSN